ncbi:beta-lactamase/transpeptidase-like protein [Aaosphaeria arxii CBS 175.79]|uniref:Beta-lactamase/transpeptidase-like protein n=1 Tax=Aaosphaeria arxii CBS 175.79 TaxID=1450172 RepID=A0A6A5XBD0_9PLEO|nr:beta-lactamase/transpeptidase-like protein [Aaosphaeria arxii CBS 175.79]KAF2010156.1 beta-lactamase/transpeptidase-like protein [Aaosphaeria arxii CBS 175.79]
MAFYSETKVAPRHVTSEASVPFDQAYKEAIEKKILPGYALIAGGRDGNILYSKADGVASLKEGETQPFKLDTICWIASMTKLLTSVACLQAVEAGLLELEKPVTETLPEVGKYGILTGWNDEKNEGIYEQHKTPVTLRMLLCHTSGYEYDWFSPLLAKWRASRNEQPWTGPTVEDKTTLPLLFEPGTSFRYGGSPDWTGKLIERVTGKSLEEFMVEKIFEPLGIKDLTFYPKKREDMKDRLATLSTLSETGEAPAKDASDQDMLFGGTDCLGGGGGYGSAQDFFTFLQAVLRRDNRLLNSESYDELFRPQLNDEVKTALNEYLRSSPAHAQFLGMSLPQEIEKTWSFAGLTVEQDLEGRMLAGTHTWGGVPSMTWYMDHKAGICGVAFCQIMPPMFPGVLALHEQFQRAMYAKATKGEQRE